MLHIADGESVAGTLRESGVPGDVMIYGDLMYEGPAPPGDGIANWLEARAGFLSQSGDWAPEEARRYLAAGEETLAAVPRHDEAILWLDHRLSDQLILIRLLHRFGRLAPGLTRFSLVSGDGSAALGGFTAPRLAALAATRIPISDAQFRLGGEAWSAFTSADPTPIERVIQSGATPLPYLAAAFRRHLEQFPSTRDGLSRTERQILHVLREQGPLSRRRLFFAVAKMEPAPFMGDGSFFRILGSLASVARPLIAREEVAREEAAREEAAVHITPAGVRVLERRDDHVRLNGIDRWLGGVHLNGSNPWRWDPGSGRLRFPPNA